jgi:hypothetical protein
MEMATLRRRFMPPEKVPAISSITDSRFTWHPAQSRSHQAHGSPWPSSLRRKRELALSVCGRVKGVAVRLDLYVCVCISVCEEYTNGAGASQTCLRAWTTASRSSAPRKFLRRP